MRYYSEDLNLFFKTEEECLEAEEQFRKDCEKERLEYQKREEKRKQDLLEIQKAKMAYKESYEKYRKMLRKYSKEYDTTFTWLF